MNKNLIDDDKQKIEKNGKLFRIVGIIGAIITGICNLLMIIAKDFNIGAFILFLFCVFMAFVSKKD